MSTTGVPVGDPHQRQVTEGAWSTGLCDCFSDVSNCCMTCFCPCVTFGQIAEMTDKGATSCGLGGALYTLLFCLTGLHSCYSCFYRIKMREQYNIQGSACVDCLTHYFCEGCALCQEYRELKSRGFDMSLGVGWNENMKRQNEGVPMAPVMDTGMNR